MKSTNGILGGETKRNNIGRYVKMVLKEIGLKYGLSWLKTRSIAGLL
jgi:hypothetical protein